MSTKPEMPTYTVGYAIRGSKGNEEVLLGVKTSNKKSRKMGTAGKLIGYGGELEDYDESAKTGFIREFLEETGRPNTVINPRNVREAASVEIRREDGKTFLLKVFLLFRYRGRPLDTREIKGARWYPARNLPNNVMPSDQIFFRRILDDNRLITGWLLYARGKRMVLKDFGLEPQH